MLLIIILSAKANYIQPGDKEPATISFLLHSETGKGRKN